MKMGQFRGNDELVGHGDEGLGPRFRGDDGGRSGDDGEVWVATYLRVSGLFSSQ